jgi:hypothetical protein
VKLTVEEEEVMEKGEDVLVNTFVLRAVGGEGAIVNLERCDITCCPTPLAAELFIL